MKHTEFKSGFDEWWYCFKLGARSKGFNPYIGAATGIIGTLIFIVGSFIVIVLD